MTDITELAQSLKAAAVRVIKNYDSEWFEAGHQICTVHKSKINLISLANPVNVLALVEALEKAQQVDEELCKLLPPGAEYMDPPDGGDVTPLEGVRRMVADYRQRIADLESRTVSVKLPDDAEHDIMAPVAAYLSEKFKWDGSAALWDGRKEYDVLADRVKYALRMVIRRAAGIKVEVE
ncbi:TPA: hypothetical protein ACTX9H_000703 [Klebsiella variicola subsp. variicola]